MNLRIRSHLLKKSSVENFTFCAVQGCGFHDQIMKLLKIWGSGIPELKNVVTDDVIKLS